MSKKKKEKKKNIRSTSESIHQLIPTDLCIKVKIFIFIVVTNDTPSFNAIYRLCLITRYDSLQIGLAITHIEI